MVKQFNTYLRLIKFSHTIFAMPFALIGFFLGLVFAWAATPDQRSLPLLTLLRADNDGPSRGVSLFLLVLACMVFARSAAMAFNRYLDRVYDARNPRTATREIPSGQVQPRHALLFTVVSSILFVLAALCINKLCFFLSPLALLVVLGYSYTKRFTPLCHLVLGAGLSLAPIGAFLAVTGQFHVLPVLFSVLVLCWVSGFDIIYSLQDEAFDRSQQLLSIPVWLGKAGALRAAELLHGVCAVLVVAAGWWGGFGWLYGMGALFFMGMLVYQHRLVSPHDLSRVNVAFMTANGVASVVFACFVIADLLF